MLLTYDKAGKTLRFRTDIFFDITISINKQHNVNCYYLDSPAFSYYQSPEFTGSLDAGGSVNCERVSLYAHGSGTHTESALHVDQRGVDMRHISIPLVQPSLLCTVTPEHIGEDEVITPGLLSHVTNEGHYTGIIIRTLPNVKSKLQRNYSGTNAPYFAPETLEMLKQAGFKHLVCDLPSVDKESDEGRMAAHKHWFIVDGAVPADRTITELVYISNDVPDGEYMLGIQAPAIETDAVASRIVIYPC